jgi:hypothetical protein
MPKNCPFEVLKLRVQAHIFAVSITQSCEFAGCGRMWDVNSTSIAVQSCAAIASIIIIT